jgi:hypothetical protein
MLKAEHKIIGVAVGRSFQAAAVRQSANGTK